MRHAACRPAVTSTRTGLSFSTLSAVPPRSRRPARAVRGARRRRSARRFAPGLVHDRARRRACAHAAGRRPGRRTPRAAPARRRATRRRDPRARRGRRSSGRSSGTSSTCSRTIVEPRSAASRAAAMSASSDSGERTIGTTIVRYSATSDGPSTSAGARSSRRSEAWTTRDGRRRRRRTRARASRGRPSASPAFWTTITSHASPVAQPAEDARTAASRRRARRRFGRARNCELLLAPPIAQYDDRGVRDRERQHRAERVHRPEEVDLAGQHRRRSSTIPAKTTSAIQGVLNRECTCRNTPGSCR